MNKKLILIGWYFDFCCRYKDERLCSFQNVFLWYSVVSGYRQFIFEYKYIFIYMLYAYIQPDFHVSTCIAAVVLSSTYKGIFVRLWFIQTFCRFIRIACADVILARFLNFILEVSYPAHSPVYAFLNKYCINVLYYSLLFILLLFSSFDDSYVQTIMNCTHRFSVVCLGR